MEPEREGHPILMGLVALVGVGLVVGLLISGAALAGTSVLGLREGTTGTGSSGKQSLYLPAPSLTESTGPQLTLAPTPRSSQHAGRHHQAAPHFPITLSASETQVAPMGQIDLTGIYPGGEGAIVQVQRLENGQWMDFATVDAVVSNQTFTTYVETGQVGLNRFRVRDTDTNAVSNPVRVRVGG